jgi:uncharacterized protein with PQ loop repeat
MRWQCNLMYNPSLCLKTLRKITKNLTLVGVSMMILVTTGQFIYGIYGTVRTAARITPGSSTYLFIYPSQIAWCSD